MIPEDMEIISPLTSTALPDEYAAYIDILEKTNQQLSLWFNPYGLMVGALSILVALGAIVAGAFIFRLGKDYKDLIETLKSKVEDQLKLINEQEGKTIDEKNVQNDNFKAVPEAKKKIEVIRQEKKPAAIGRIPIKSLIKPQSLNFIYWYASNGIRYTFPTEDVFNSWFPLTDFRPTILTITDAQTADISLGGNIYYRAGTRLVKIASDPKIYAIAHNGVLRWVKTDELLLKIFGSAWVQKLVTVPDVLFVQYQIGSTITEPSDYSPETERQLDQLG